MSNPPRGLIFDIRKFSIHDGPGIRTTVFFKGCPLACQWCHNPESQSSSPELWINGSRCIRCGACQAVCPQEAIDLDGAYAASDPEKCILCGSCASVCAAEAREIAGREMGIDQVLAAIESDLAFYDESGGGVTFSGGEPLMQPRFLRLLLQACREREIHTALDTCGFASWNTLDSLRSLVDLFLYDLKLMDNTWHHRFTGVSNRPILDNLRRLGQHGHALILRLPVIPGITDDPENIRQIGAFAAALPTRPRLDLLPYHAAAETKYQRLGKAYPLAQVLSPSRDHLLSIAETLQHFGLQVNIGG